MNKRFSLLTAGIIALFSACSDNVVESYPQTGSPVVATAKLHVLVQDGSDKSLVADADVTLLSVGKVAKTSAGGTVSFDSVAVGSHGIRIEKTGYASVVNNILIESETAENIYQALERSVSLSLYPLTASLEGYLRYTDKNGSQQPASGAIVRLVLNGSAYLNSQFQDTVDATGKYEFNGLPALSNSSSYSIYALEYTVEGITYPAQRIVDSYDIDGGLLAGSQAFAGYVTYSRNTSSFELLGWTDKISSNGDVVFTFSDSIDAAKFSSNQVSTSPVLDFDVVVDGQTLTLKPKGGKWSDNPDYSTVDNFNVTIINLKSVKGNSTSPASLSRRVDLRLENSAFTLLNYTDRISADSNVVFTFSDTIDPKKFSSNLISITNPVLDFYDSLAGHKLIIKPKGGKWIIDPVLYPSNNGTFNVSVSNLTSIRGKKITSGGGTVNLLLDNSQFELISYTERISIDSNIVFKFSDAIDSARVSTSTVSIYSLDFNIAYSSDKTQLILKPKGGKWNTSNTSITVNIDNLPSVKGKTVSPSRQINLIHTFKLLSDHGSQISLAKNTDTIEFKFSKAIDAKKFYRGTGQGTSTVWAGSQADIIVKDSSILVLPLDKWTGDFTIYFHSGSAYVLTSVSGELVTTIPNISVKLPWVNLSTLQVTGLVNTDSSSINHNSSNPTLRWNKLEGATGYKVYAKASKGSNEWAQQSSGFINDTTAYIYLSSNSFADGGEVEFLVQAYNDNSQTLLNGARIIKAFDRVKPTQSSYTTITNQGENGTLYVYDWHYLYEGYTWFNGTEYVDVSYIQYLLLYSSSGYRQIQIYFSEPIDTSAVTLSIDPALPRTTVTPSWMGQPNPQYLYLTLTVASGNPIEEPVNSVISISGIKDKRGNAYELNYGTPSAPVLRNTLDFRIQATP